MIKYLPNKNEILVSMARKGFNQKMLCEKTGLNPSTISLLLNNKKSVSARTATKIVEVLENDLENLFEIKINNKGELEDVN